ncbi:hypothetical protein OTU49_014586 [Cherax quadricarinatus]|uniref:Secreted protein n=1 Tax=Cherax quadricarinatus TaxID=27406 RepID=A0AAW0VQC3_CHEQU
MALVVPCNVCANTEVSVTLLLVPASVPLAGEVTTVTSPATKGCGARDVPRCVTVSTVVSATTSQENATALLASPGISVSLYARMDSSAKNVGVAAHVHQTSLVTT